MTGRMVIISRVIDVMKMAVTNGIFFSIYYLDRPWIMVSVIEQFPEIIIYIVSFLIMTAESRI